MNHDLLHELEKKIGYTFQNRELIVHALTHSSYSNEEKAKGRHADSNERMEFLGDAVLSIIVSTYLFDNFSGAQEGELSKIRSAVVCEKALASYADEIELGKYLLLGHGEEINNGRERPSILSDAYESAEVRYAPNGTFNNFNATLLTDSRLDHIFFTKPVRAKKYGVLTDTYRVKVNEEGFIAPNFPKEYSLYPSEARVPSDHFPVMVVLELK